MTIRSRYSDGSGIGHGQSLEAVYMSWMKNTHGQHLNGWNKLGKDCSWARLEGGSDDMGSESRQHKAIEGFGEWRGCDSG